MSESITPRLDALIERVSLLGATLDAAARNVAEAEQDLIQLRSAIQEIKADDPVVTPMV
jgi:C4-dicarboxylate-specific signal transduction histidine kinase